MRDELRGIILEALYNQRRKDLVSFDQELGGLPVPHDVAMDHSEANQNKPKSFFERISKWLKDIVEKLGWV